MSSKLNEAQAKALRDRTADKLIDAVGCADCAARIALNIAVMCLLESERDTSKYIKAVTQVLAQEEWGAFRAEVFS